MNGTEVYEADPLESLVDVLDSIESDESDESDESYFAERRRRGSRPSTVQRPKMASGNVKYQPQPTKGYVTQTEMRTALAEVGQQIKTNTEAIDSVRKQINTQIKTIGDLQLRLDDSLKKEASVRKKEIGALSKDLESTRQMAALLPMLTKQQSLTVTQDIKQKDATTNADVTVIPKDTKLLKDTDGFSLLMPMMLMMMPGMSTGTGSSGQGGFSDPMTMMLMVLAFSGKL